MTEYNFYPQIVKNIGKFDDFGGSARCVKAESFIEIVRGSGGAAPSRWQSALFCQKVPFSNNCPSTEIP